MGQQIQVIDGDGHYCSDSVVKFTEGHKLADAGLNYVVVAIMGPQSSGKSTLLNTLFGTDFKMMDADEGRSQTTKGIWLDKSVKTVEVSTLVMDLEGSDGRERGEDDTTFERQSALFALATSDILMVNMFAINIGRVQGSGAPLLKTIFQVNMKLFQSAPGKRRTVLLFVIRDRTRTPLARLSEDLGKDLAAIWDSLVKAPEQADSTLEDFFDVHYVSLPSYEVEPEDFQAEATILRRKFSPTHAESLLNEETNRVPAGAIPLNFEKMWDIISTQKDLDLPAHKVMVANVRCNQIADDQFAAITSDQAWVALHTETKDSIILTDFKSRASGLIESGLYGYNQEAIFFECGVRDDVHDDLKRKLLLDLEPAYKEQVALRHGQLLKTLYAQLADAKKIGLESFQGAATRCQKTALASYTAMLNDELTIPESGWPTGVEDLNKAVDTAVADMKKEHIAACRATAQEEVEAAVEGPVWEVLNVLPEDFWVQMRRIVKNAISGTVTHLDKQLTGYSVPKEALDELHQEVGQKACQKLIKVLREDLRRASFRLKEKFDSLFEEDNGVQRVWNPRIDIRTVAKEANIAAVKLLAQLTMTPESAGLLMPGASPADMKKAKVNIMEFTAKDIDPTAALEESRSGGLLTLSRWYDSVPKEAVLLNPREVRDVWRDFLKESKKAVHRATELQEERRRSSSKGPPVWALAAILVLGYDEFKGLIRNPVLLIFCLVACQILWQLYCDLEVDKELEKGFPVAAYNISRRIRPVCGNLANSLSTSAIDFLKYYITDDSQKTKPLQASTSSASPSPPSEIAMSTSVGSPVDGLRQRVAAPAQDNESLHTSVKDTPKDR